MLGGGIGTLETIMRSIQNKIPVLIIEESGRIAGIKLFFPNLNNNKSSLKK